MILKSIRLKEGFFERTIQFSDYVNLIYSQNNSKGKTTLLRFILYAMGYSIPNTKNIKFDQCEVELTIKCEKNGLLLLTRLDSNSIEVTTQTGKVTYALPEQQNELHYLLFGTNNTSILSNLLGAFYVDQEKGWTLLNRGTVIGSIRFNIEELVRGLSDIDCSDLLKKEKRISNELAKYRQMLSIAQYRESVQVETGSLAVEKYEDEIDAAVDQLVLQQKRAKTELNRIDKTLSDNRNFKKFISEMRLLVEAPDGTRFPVTCDNIVGLNDAIDLLLSKRRIVLAEYTEITKQLEKLQHEQENEEQQLAFFEVATQAEIFDKQIVRLPLNAVAIKHEINRLDKELKQIRAEISNVTKTNSIVITEIATDIIHYATELGLGDKDSISAAYMFTSNLKELSGAILHKTAFAFRLAFIKAIEKKLRIKLPIILDSPSGKEVDQTNINLMMGILKRDFSDHQILIASIFQYEFDSLKIIEIFNHLIEEI